MAASTGGGMPEPRSHQSLLLGPFPEVSCGNVLKFKDVMIVDESILHDRHQDMRPNIDTMSCEDLSALEEQMGAVSTGLAENVVQESLKQQKYKSSASCKADSCCICLEDYAEGEDLGGVGLWALFPRFVYWKIASSAELLPALRCSF